MMRREINLKDWWSFPAGPQNRITDIAGVRLGHHTMTEGGARTGVTAITPAPGDLFQKPLRAAAEVHNGFGKSLGLI